MVEKLLSDQNLVQKVYIRHFFGLEYRATNVLNTLQLRILCVHIETSSLWAEFVNVNRCISVRLVSEEARSIQFL